MNVTLSGEARKDFARLPYAMKARVADVFARLADYPSVSGLKALRRKLKGYFRIRTGDWRIVFRIDGEAVEVVRIDNRKEVYDG